jgi:ABC-type Zn uptake system ZnuABC Zn-binding protein ZnuA
LTLRAPLAAILRARGAAGLALLAVAALTITCAACGGAGGDAPGGKLNVVATESFLADIAQNVAGSRFTVHALVPVGTDPHAYEPVPRDVARVVAADLLIVNGGGLEGTLLTTLKNAGGNVTTVDASAGLKSRTPQPGEPPLEGGGTDPHFWLDPILVKTYVANIRDAFIKADPSGAAAYRGNAAAYIVQLAKLDGWIKAQVAQVAPQNRRLVMDHASHGYFADRYGFSVVGTVIPSLGTSETPTARQLADLAASIRTRHARAIFVEIGENPDLARQIATETGIKVVTGLLDHSLSKPGGPAPTYIDMMKYDTRLIVEALK